VIRSERGIRRAASGEMRTFRRVVRWGKWGTQTLADRAAQRSLHDDGQEHTMANRSTATSIDEYIAEFPPETRAALEEMRALIRSAAPGATETISYAIPTFDLNGKHLVHFAGYAKHVGFYPVPSAMEAFKQELEPYRSGKGSAQFPLSEPLPADLIRRIVTFRVAESAGTAPGGGPKP
jgi:uncharacterized protein YdhG (YjbR/CyaY superfamily)